MSRPPPYHWPPPQPPRFPAFVRPPPPPPRTFPRPPGFYQQPPCPPRGFFPRFVAPRPPPPPPVVDPEKTWLQSFKQTHCNPVNASTSTIHSYKEPPLRVLRRRVLRAQELVERLKAAATGLETVDKRLYNLGAYYKQQSEEENAAQKVEISRLCVQRERKFSACEALKTELETMNATSGLFPEQELAEIRRFLARVKKKKAYRKRVKSQRRAERSICRAVGLQQSEELLFATEDKAQENTQDVCEKSANDHEDREEKITTEPDEQSATNLSAPVQSAAASFLDPETLTINALISIRRVWDSFIVYAQTPGASTIPPHFIPPPPKPSAQWSAYSTAG